MTNTLVLLCILLALKGGLYLKGLFPPLNLGLMRISRSRFKQSKNSMLISQIYGVAVICKFLGDFWGFLGRDSFSQRISKIWRNKKYGRFDLFLKLEFEVKN